MMATREPAFAAAAEQIGIADHLLVIDAGNRRHARPHTGSDDDLVEFCHSTICFNRRQRVQPYVDAVPAELDSEVAQRLVELLLARHFTRVAELPTDLAIPLEQRDGSGHARLRPERTPGLQGPHRPRRRDARPSRARGPAPSRAAARGLTRQLAFFPAKIRSRHA